MTAETVRLALARAQAGESATAIAMLASAAASGSAPAHIALGLWRIEGRHLPRDLAAARADFAAAMTLGDPGAARVTAGLLATGTGGPRDWPGALALLDEWSDRDPLAARQSQLLGAMQLDAIGDPAQPIETDVLSNAPYAACIPGLLTAAECDFLVDVSQSRFRRAEIFHEARQTFVQDPVRQSECAGFSAISEWPAVHAINRRIAAASRTAVEQGEPLQLLRYQPGDSYRPHLDAIPSLTNQRILTLLVYLNADYDGGETHFRKSGLRFRGTPGDALLFANATDDGRPDPATEHEGLPVTRGVKYLASRWIRARPPEPGTAFGPEEATAQPR